MAGQPDNISYYNLDVTVQRAGSGYRAQLHSQSGENVNITFGKPFSDLELENFLLRAGYSKRSVRRIDTQEVAAAKEVGGKLYGAIFKGEAQETLRRDLDYAISQNARLRVRLCLTDVPELADLPWEYMYNSSANKFLALSVETPIVRYLELRERIQPLVINPPLRVLMMISSPSDYPTLDVKAEAGNLHAALGDLEKRGLVVIEEMEDANLPALQRRLRRGEYHIFHFIGHGGFDRETEQGVLILEDENHRGRPVSGQDLGMLLHDHRSLRLAILNACEGARADRKDPFAGTAQSLVQQGIPAVIAMQFEITDQAAISFAHEFYEAISDNYPVDAALTEARKCLFGQGSGLEWGTPVLYLRAPNGRIFDIQRGPYMDNRSKTATMVWDANAAMQQEQWQTAVEKWQAVLAVDPSNTEAQTKLDEAKRQQQLVAALEEGRSHLEAGRTGDALNRLEWVRNNTGPNFRGVDALIASAQQKTTSAQTASRTNALYNEAQAAVAAENWPVAIQRWQAILTIDPSNMQAKGGLEYSQNQQQLYSAYEDGLTKYKAGRLQEALEALQWVRANSGGLAYKQVDSYINETQRALAARSIASSNTAGAATRATGDASTITSAANATNKVTTTTNTYMNTTNQVVVPAKPKSNTTKIVLITAVITLIVVFMACAALGFALQASNSNSYSGSGESLLSPISYIAPAAHSIGIAVVVSLGMM